MHSVPFNSLLEAGASKIDHSWMCMTCRREAWLRKLMLLMETRVFLPELSAVTTGQERGIRAFKFMS